MDKLLFKLSNLLGKVISKEKYESLKKKFHKYYKNPIAFFKYDAPILNVNTLVDNGYMLQCAKSSGDYFSQCGQDFFLANTIFKGKTDGVFLDVGANDPVVINNTYYFEKIGWTGIAFEPQKHHCEKYNSVRKTKCLDVAVGCEDTTIWLHRDDEYDTLASVSNIQEGSAYEVKQVRISDVCDQNNITHVDYMSLDLEGYEENAINGIDFEKLTIDVISLENAGAAMVLPEKKIRKLLESKGFVRIARIVIDDIFISKKLYQEKFCKFDNFGGRF